MSELIKNEIGSNKISEKVGEINWVETQIKETYKEIFESKNELNDLTKEVSNNLSGEHLKKMIEDKLTTDHVKQVLEQALAKFSAAKEGMEGFNAVYTDMGAGLVFNLQLALAKLGCHFDKGIDGIYSSRGSKSSDTRKRVIEFQKAWNEICAPEQKMEVDGRAGKVTITNIISALNDASWDKTKIVRETPEGDTAAKQVVDKSASKNKPEVEAQPAQPEQDKPIPSTRVKLDNVSDWFTGGSTETKVSSPKSTVRPAPLKPDRIPDWTGIPGGIDGLKEQAKKTKEEKEKKNKETRSAEEIRTAINSYFQTLAIENNIGPVFLGDNQLADTKILAQYDRNKQKLETLLPKAKEIYTKWEGDPKNFQIAFGATNQGSLNTQKAYLGDNQLVIHEDYLLYGKNQTAENIILSVLERDLAGQYRGEIANKYGLAFIYSSLDNKPYSYDRQRQTLSNIDKALHAMKPQEITAIKSSTLLIVKSAEEAGKTTLDSDHKG